MSRLTFLYLLLTLTGCGYHLGSGPYIEKGTKIFIPYIQGDKKGTFTNALIHAVESQSPYRFSGGSADRVLRVTVLSINHQHVGWRYDKDKEGNLIDTTIPQETRLTMVVVIEFLDGATYQHLAGPFELRETIDFDHDYYYSADSINVSSSGQLTDYDTAFDIAMETMYEKMSQKIVDAIAF